MVFRILTNLAESSQNTVNVIQSKSTKMEDERKTVLKLLNSSYFKTLIKSQAVKDMKDSLQSEMFRKAGNEIYKGMVHNSKVHDGVWNFYSLSIARSESNTEGLAMSYGNRSAILLHISKYEESIRDIERALNITANDSLKIKLLLRKAKCLHMIGSEDDHRVLKEADLLLNKITNKNLKKLNRAELDKVKITLDKPAVSKVQSKNKNVKAIKALHKNHKLHDFSSVEIKCNAKYGKHLVAAKNISPGEVIFVEKPYIQFVNMLKMHAYCIHCFTIVWDSIPCDHCCWAMFCSEKCKKEAWKKYHDIECTIYSDFELEDNDSFVQLAIRILSQAIKKYGSVEYLKAKISTFDDGSDYRKGFTRDGKLEASDLESIYFLCKDVSVGSSEDHTTNTAVVLRSLGRSTSLLGRDFDSTDVESYKNNENAIFLGSLFLRLCKISQLNAFQMWNRSYICENKLIENACCDSKRECCAAGSFIAPMTGLLNHDCFPNAGRCYTSEHTVVIYAIKPIQKGTQIFTSYLKIFSENGLAIRQESLLSRYNFRCDCFSCKHQLETILTRSHKQSTIVEMFQIPSVDMLDLQLATEYKDILQVAERHAFENFKCDEMTILHLTRGLEKAFAPSRSELPPSPASCALVGAMQIIFEMIYGIKMNVPKKCNNI